MNDVVLRVVTAGVASVTDLGRPGLAALGVAGGGASDRFAAALAGTLVGNRPDDPVVEVTWSGFAFVPDAPVLLAVTGAAEQVLVDGEAYPAHELLAVPAGARCEVRDAVHGWRTYLAVNGRIDAPRLLGSAAPDARLSFGTRLAAGDELRVSSRFGGLDHPVLRQPVFRLGSPVPDLRGPAIVDVTPGPEADEFLGGLEGAYEVSPSSDAVGLRLSGPAPVRATGGEILSRGVPVGAIEVPPGGGLLALLRERLATAGYPVVAVATTVAIDRMAQLRPQDAVAFRLVTLHEAQAVLRRREAGRTDLATRVRTALTAVGLADCLRSVPGSTDGEVEVDDRPTLDRC